MKNIIKYEGEFTTELLKRYKNNLTNLVSRALPCDQLKALTLVNYGHPSEIMSLEMAQEFMKNYPQAVKEAKENWPSGGQFEKLSGDELLHKLAVEVFLSECRSQQINHIMSIKRVGDASKTLHECKEIIARRDENNRLVKKIIRQSGLDKAHEPENLILYNSQADGCTAYFLNHTVSSLLYTLGDHCFRGDFHDHTRGASIGFEIESLMDQLAQDDDYKKLSSRARNKLFQENATVPGLIKSLKRSLTEQKIPINSALKENIISLARAHDISVNKKKYYSFVPKGRDNRPDNSLEITFNEPVEALLHLLGVDPRNKHYGLIVGDKKIAECLKNSGDEIIKTKFSATQRRELLREIARLVENNRWVLPQAHKSLTKVNDRKSRGR